MSQALPLIRIAMRASILILLVLGLLFWSGRALPLVPLHMAFGLVFVLGLCALAAIAAMRGAPLPLVAGAAVLGLAVLALGMTQARILPGSGHWIIQALHLLLGLGAMGLAERLARGAAASSATRTDTMH
jgi:hypothetical protein